MFISNDLKWNKHVSYLQSEAYATAFQILKTVVSTNVWTLLNAYITFVRPQLEFNTPVWSPHPQKDIFLIESVQKRFTRSICLRDNIPFSCYADRLNKLNNKSLQYRRLEFDLILTYKICYGLVDIAFNDFFEYWDTDYDLRRHRLALRPLCRPKHKTVQNFFNHRVVPLWKDLPENIVTSPKLLVFKNCLKHFNIYNIATILY